MTACLRAGIVILIVEGLREQRSGKRFGPRTDIIIVICSQVRISVALIGTKTPQMIVFVVYERDLGVIFTSVGDGQQAAPVIVSVCKNCVGYWKTSTNPCPGSFPEIKSLLSNSFDTPSGQTNSPGLIT